MLLDLLKRKKQGQGAAPAAVEVKPAAKAREPHLHTCGKCSGKVSHEEWVRNLKVCMACGHHERMGARERLHHLLDGGALLETGMEIQSCDPLNFPGYPEKLDQARDKSVETESVVTGIGRIEGQEVCVFVMDPEFMMGSLGSATGERITRIAETALEKRLPLVGFCASGGARMQEGILSLMQMAKTSSALGRLAEAGIPYFVVLTDPTTGGVTASYAMLGDIILAEPGALIGFAGQRVIEQTIRQSLPEGFQRAEFLLEKGFLDGIVERKELRRSLGRLLSMHSGTGGKIHGADA